MKAFTLLPSRRPSTGSFSLHYKRQGKPLAHVIPDPKWPGMYRVRGSDGTLSDLVNLARAKDAAERVVASKISLHDRNRLTWRESFKGGGTPLARPPIASNPPSLVPSLPHSNPPLAAKQLGGVRS